jgi:hypothetical protein
MSATGARLSTTPDRPRGALEAPPHTLEFDVEVNQCHLANPAVAVARLLASEAQALCRVTGDETHLEVQVALADDQPDTRQTASAWVRWALHNAGVRGEVRER